MGDWRFSDALPDDVDLGKIALESFEGLAGQFSFFADLPSEENTSEWEKHPVVRYLPSGETVGRGSIAHRSERAVTVGVELYGKLAPALHEAVSQGAIAFSWAYENYEYAPPEVVALDLSPR